MDCSPLFYPATQGIQHSWHSKIKPTCGGQGIELDSVRVTPQLSRRQTNSTSPRMSRAHNGLALVRSPRAMIARKDAQFPCSSNPPQSKLFHIAPASCLFIQIVCRDFLFHGHACFAASSVLRIFVSSTVLSRQSGGHYGW